MSSRNLIFDSSSSSSSRSSLILLGSSTSVFSGVKSMVMGAAEDGMASERRPFFSSPDENYKDFYEELLPEKKRHLTSEQIRMLERSFKEENKLEPERKSKLAKQLGLQPRQVAVWFQNRRARWKNKQVEHDYDRLKASYDSLILSHNAARKDNDHLRWQVNFLLEKLQENDQQGTSGVPVPSLDDQAALSTNPMALNIQQKVDDLLSTGSGIGTATAVGVEPHLLVEEPFLSASCHKVTLLSGAGIHSEDDISACNYHHQQQEMQLDEWLDYVQSIFLH
ncbi:homeobox-leucine zipper protein HAT5-like [Zingiber officinale]|uniref:Homeobox-leucine zipper protein n=1 Tax=Zingiber officinale TaxID=94328 RepID=A0A8J5H0C3_ZINOF|nr:homeobox-leucine zipper protein HAT5-like [Zingiber officinale]KAG6514768.1 hypothetical protein ZIOFF_025138 [Zingiber officinale]